MVTGAQSANDIALKPTPTEPPMPKPITIAIVDDEAAQTEFLSRLVAAWAGERSVDVRIHTFESALSLKFALGDAGAFDILLLDVQMPGMDGMELARRLRERGDHAPIVFISGFAEWLPQGYDVDALNYLLKPVKQSQLFAVLDKAAARIAQEPCYVLLNVEGEMQRYEADSILYAEAFSHTIELHMPRETLTLRMSMKELETLLGEGFLRCHRSYVVNVRHIASISRTEITLTSGAKLPLSRAMYNAVNEAFVAHNWRK
jgi:DNA-binding LytR/AlgR family response regulator